MKYLFKCMQNFLKFLTLLKTVSWMYLIFLVEVMAQLETGHCDNKWKNGDQLAKVHELKW